MTRIVKKAHLFIFIKCLINVNRRSLFKLQMIKGQWLLRDGRTSVKFAQFLNTTFHKLINQVDDIFVFPALCHLSKYVNDVRLAEPSTDNSKFDGVVHRGVKN